MNDVKLENVELQEEEVNIYTSDCGVTRKACITDCFMTTYRKHIKWKEIWYGPGKIFMRL